MSDALANHLLAYLRRTVTTDVTFAEPPAQLTGGYDTTILAFRLDNAPEALSIPLVLRVMRSADMASMALRERVTQDAVVTGGFPAPRVLLSSMDSSELGAPFLIMERLPGVNMWDNIFGKDGKFTRLFRLTKTLAEMQRQLHALDPQPYLDGLAAAGLDPEDCTLAGGVRSIATRIERAGLVGLKPGAEWLLANLPPQPQRVAICHADFHALNIIMDGDNVSGVVDWSQTIVADPAYDVACTAVLLRFGPSDLTGLLRWLFERVRPLPIRRFLSASKSGGELDVTHFRYYECVRVLSALTFGGELDPAARNPWSDPATTRGLARYFERNSGVILTTS